MSGVLWPPHKMQNVARIRIRKALRKGTEHDLLAVMKADKRVDRRIAESRYDWHFAMEQKIDYERLKYPSSARIIVDEYGSAEVPPLYCDHINAGWKLPNSDKALPRFNAWAEKNRAERRTKWIAAMCANMQDDQVLN